MTLDIIRVDSARKAAAMLSAEGGARFVGGGTLVMRDVHRDGGTINKLVLCDGLNLDKIAVDGGRVTLGAAVTMGKIAAEPKLAYLKPVARSIGGPAVRAMATVGGNLFAPYPYGDFAVALLALGATVTVETLDGTETVDLEHLLKRRNGAPSGIVLSVAFDLPPDDAFRFAKVVRRKPQGASVLSIAALLPMAKGKVAGARVAYGAMAATAMRATAVEGVLEGRQLDATTIAAAVAVATEGCAPRTDPQASDWYRLAVLPVHLKRMLSA